MADKMFSARMRQSCVGCRSSHLKCDGAAPSVPGAARIACWRCLAVGRPCEFVRARVPGPALGKPRTKPTFKKRAHALVDDDSRTSEEDDDVIEYDAPLAPLFSYFDPALLLSLPLPPPLPPPSLPVHEMLLCAMMTTTTTTTTTVSLGDPNPSSAQIESWINA